MTEKRDDFDLLIPTLNPEKVQVPPWLNCNVLTSTLKGRSVARNDLAKRSNAPYFLYIDEGTILPKETFNFYVDFAILHDQIVAYKGRNGVLCTRVFGIPRDIFFEVGGFDETFDEGEDMEIGYRLAQHNYWVQLIPNDAVGHRGTDTFNVFTAAVNHARLRLRYPDLYTMPHKAAIYFPVTLLAYTYYKYFKCNERKNVCFKS